MSLLSRSILLAVSLLLAALFIRLGRWQTSRLHERRASNRVAEAARSEGVVDLNAPSPGAIRTNRRVVLQGEYDRSQEIILRGHVLRELPGVHVVTPLRLAGQDSAVLVNRGFVPAADAVHALVENLDEPGMQRVEGIALQIPVSDDSGAVVQSRGGETWRRLDLAALRARLPYPIFDVYVLQQPDTSLPRYPIRLEPQPLDDGPHLSYAIQWFAFAAITVAGSWLLLIRKQR
jgi:surfeit locus 1 family protein